MIELCVDNASENSRENYENLKQIEYFDCQKLSYNVFYNKFLIPNIPCVITGLSGKWECNNWFRNDQVDFEYMAKKLGALGHKKVPVTNCSKKAYDSHEKSTIYFHDFANYWKNRNQKDDVLYLKDWHLKNELPGYEFYRVPEFFGSDWLNEYLLDTNKDDYRFVYMGVKDSWTPFHTDVLGSFSWSTNIFGRKKWILLPPGEELKLADKLGNFPFDIDDIDYLVRNQVKHFTLIQKCDETIFVPSNWYHQVWNLEDTVSVNHNWFNSCNILKVYRNMKKNLDQVENEIQDCLNMQNFEDHCQVMLKSLFGMHFEDLLTLLHHICEKRIESLTKISTNFVFDRYFYSKSHIIRDLEAILEVLEIFQLENKELLCFLNLAPLLDKCVQNIRITIR